MELRPQAGSAPPRSQLVVWVLIALCALRVAACFLPTGYVWGVSFARDVAPALAWSSMLALCAAVLASVWSPSPARPAADFGPGLRRAWPWLLGLGLVLLLCGVPDRLHFVGDFVLRLGILESRNGFEKIFPQALPLDRLLNHLLPIAVGEVASISRRRWCCAGWACSKRSCW